MCLDCWHKEYSGYIAVGYTHEGNSMLNCNDENLKKIKSSGATQNVPYLYTVYT